jgi:hypothetical protein
MRLALIEQDPAADPPDREKRTFRCDACGHSETKTVKYR